MDSSSIFLGWTGITAFVVAVPLSILANLLTPLLSNWWERRVANTRTKSYEGMIRRYRKIIDHSKEQLKVINANEYSAIMQTENRHKLSMAALFLGFGAAVTRIDPSIGIPPHISFGVEVLSFFIGLVFVLWASRYRRRLYPRERERWRSSTARYIELLESRLQRYTELSRKQ
jgi:hypothetical protein